MRISKREIKRQYLRLLKDVETNDFYKRLDSAKRVNVYRCPKGHLNKTIDIDAGVTPFMHQCKVCRDNGVELSIDSMGQSSFYNDVAKDLEPAEEWYRPSLDEVLKLSEPEIEHVMNGGLLVRDIKSKEDAKV